MRTPRPLTGAALAAFVVAGAITGLTAGPAAYADSGASTLYVDHDVPCSDTAADAGSHGDPFCTVQAAADVVQPGQTVRIESISGDAPYAGFSLTHSGTAEAPITFTGAADTLNGVTPNVVASGGETVPVAVDGAAHVRISSLELHSSTYAATVTGGQDVTLDSLAIRDSQTPQAGVRYSGVSVDGTSSGVTLSRNFMVLSYGDGVDVASGAQDVTVTGNVLDLSRGSGGVMADGATGTAVAGNTIDDSCGPAISLTGGSTGSVENNVAGSANLATGPECADPTAGLLTVSADSASGVTADYNAISTANLSARPAYAWAGTGYPTAAALTASTGQGAHDLNTGFGVPINQAAPQGSPLIDSGDADAPGELATDMDGNPRVDDPDTANTGAGAESYVDRGAYEREDALTLPSDENPSPTAGAVPFTTSVPADATSGWGQQLTYTADFGDGSAPVTSTTGTPLTHTYTTPGTYTEELTVTAADGYGVTRTYAKLIAADTTAPAARLSVASESGGTAAFGIPSTDNWELSGRTIDYGDGDSLNLGVGFQDPTHTYPAVGDYTATLTQTDVLGRVTTATVPFRSADTFLPTTPLYDTEQTVPAHGVLKVSASRLNAGYDGTDAVELRLTASASKSSGWLITYADGTTRPGTSSLNWAAGQTVSNQAFVKVAGPGGTVDFYNGGSQPVTLTVDTLGMGNRPEAGTLYTPVAQTRLLDTRNGTGGVMGPVAADHSVTVTVAGVQGVPADATSVVLNVSANTTKAAGWMQAATHGAGGGAQAATYWTAGQSAANLVTVPVDDGKVVLTNESKGSADFLADLVGWYGPENTAPDSGAGGEYWPVAPDRVLDSKTGVGMAGGKVAQLAAHATVKIKIAGVRGLPATGLTAADLNLTVSGSTANGSLVAWADGAPRPPYSLLTFTAGRTTANQALVQAGSDGEIDLYNPNSTPIDLDADLLGGYLD